MAKTRKIAPKQLPDPSERERAQILDARAELAQRPARVSVAANLEDRVLSIGPPHADHAGWHDAMRNAAATTSLDFANFALGSAMAIVDPTGENQGRCNAALAMIQAVEPKNEVEAVMAAQMVGVHALAMDSMAKAVGADTMPRRDAFITQATKMTRTFAAQLEALAKLRSGGKQQVEVRYVYVDARGSQNVIGSELVTGGGVRGEKLGQSHAPPALAGPEAAPSVPLWGANAAGNGLPVASGAGEAPVSDAWRDEPWSAEGQG
jgi:hypothetical protein